MIKATIRLYEYSKTRIARLEKDIELQAVPHAGDIFYFYIKATGKHHRTVSEIEYNENGDILICLSDDINKEKNTPYIIDDEELNEEIIDMRESGWKVKSFVKNNKYTKCV